MKNIRILFVAALALVLSAAVAAAPTVSLLAPANNASYVLSASTPTAVVVSASATASSGTKLTRVEFYAGTTLIGTATTNPPSISWANPPAGSHSLTAKAYDDTGAVTTSAARTITVSATNTAPTVSLSAPAKNAAFVSPATISISASASAPETNDKIVKVEFYAGATLIGTGAAMATGGGYTLTWSNVAAGSYSLTARATDNQGAVTTSVPVNITVTAPPNVAPSVSLTAPAAGSSYTAPAAITLTATAADSDGSIASVTFYNGATLIGTGAAMATGGGYTLTWSNVAAGSYSLRARAVDNLGASADSAPVAVTVTDPPPPPVAAGVYYAYADHLNTPRVITDATNKIVWRWDSDPFGTDAANEDPDGDGQKFSYNLRFPGQYYDRETGLHYNYFRDYEPGTGRYVQSDPIGIAGGLNTYGYVWGNPLSYVDLFGLEVEVGVRRFHPVPVPYARHCYVRFNGKNNDTLSFDKQGVHADPNAGVGNFSSTTGKENDSCVRKKMKTCEAEQYDFTDFNCCHCVSNALDACGLKKQGGWPNWPHDANSPPYAP